MQSIYQQIFQDAPLEIDETWKHGAILGGMTTGAYDRRAIADAYKLAGDTLIRQALSGSEGYELVYPILFNYRHCLELYLKILVPHKHSHKFPYLVDELNEYVKRQYKVELPQWIKDRLLEFDEFDPRATTFRYDDQGVVSAKTGDVGEFWIDFTHLSKVMDALQTIFHRLIEENKTILTG